MNHIINPILIAVDAVLAVTDWQSGHIGACIFVASCGAFILGMWANQIVAGIARSRF